METVTIMIDGRKLTVEKGRTVLQAALEHGIRVPYYCYHPGLGVDGSCRVCVVKVEKMPKLQTACSTTCTEGMVVSTDAPEVVEARRGVFEFLLLNHPLDCPVCDKGGECPLQDFAYTFGPQASRTEFPRRVLDGEGVRADVDFGPTLMLNRNRCILCTRCVRFMRDIDGTAQIGIIDRGHGSEIATFQEHGVHSILSGNLADVCPVGAITTRDYRFRSRPWDNPQVADTICTFCSKGCNTSVWLKAKPEWAKGTRLVRITPRHNPDVNGYWMCDLGRFGYHWVEGDRRLRRPLVRNPQGLQPTPWPELLAGVRRALNDAAATPRFLLSAHASLEEMFLVRQLARRLAGEAAANAVAVSWRYHDKRQPANTRFNVPGVDAPNVQGARDLGLPLAATPHADTRALREVIEAGRVPALYILDPGPEGSIGDISWAAEARRTGRLPLLLVQGALGGDLTDVADFVLPGASPFEKEASYTNDAGLVQAAAQVIRPPGEAREDWRILIDVAAALGVELPYASAGAIRADIASELAGSPAYGELAGLHFGKAVPARTWLQTSNPSERWKWDVFFQDLPPVKFAPGAPLPERPDVARIRKID